MKKVLGLDLLLHQLLIRLRSVLMSQLVKSLQVVVALAEVVVDAKSHDLRLVRNIGGDDRHDGAPDDLFNILAVSKKALNEMVSKGGKRGFSLSDLGDNVRDQASLRDGQADEAHELAQALAELSRDRPQLEAVANVGIQENRLEKSGDNHIQLLVSVNTPWRVLILDGQVEEGGIESCVCQVDDVSNKVNFPDALPDGEAVLLQ